MAEKNDGAAAAAVPAEGKISKGDAVRKLFARLGRTAMPKAVQDDVKKTYGLDVSANYISSVKAELAGEAGAKKKKPASKTAAPAPAPAVAKKPAAAAPAANGRSPVVSLDDVLALKAIVGRVGASHVKTLIDALSS